MNPAAWTWVVVADAHGARIFRYLQKHQDWKLVEDVRPETSAPGGSLGHRADAHAGALRAQAGSQPKEKEERRLAHHLAARLERGLSEETFASLALVAPPKLLGELRENLSRALQKRVVAELNKDYTHLALKELEEQLRPELPLAGLS